MSQKQTNPEPKDAASGLGNVNSLAAFDFRENSIATNSHQDRFSDRLQQQQSFDALSRRADDGTLVSLRAPAPVAVTPHLSCDEEAAVAFRIGLVAATRETFGKHGFAAFDYTKSAAAMHEAGHALIYAALGPRPIRVSLERRLYKIGGVTKAFWGGACQTDRKSFTIDPQSTGPHEYFREIAFIAAGALAEQRFAPGGLAPGSSLDERVMAGMLCHTAEMAFGLPENAAGCLVKEIVTTLLDDFEQVWAKLSRRLFNSKVLRRAELDRLLAPVTAARGANEAKFKSLVDDFLRLAASTSAEGSAL